ncbi:zinc ribbon domain-containing protein [Sphingomonas sp. ZT3P38]|uniref:zinc ribbon domain-containing protein n=1 Tax=Parasphingomonas zepuensis TaxID=3096161 RepID=UPI002FC7B320
MAFCSQCGSQLPDGARFCPSCGVSRDEAIAAPQEAQASGYAPASPSPDHRAIPIAPAGGGARLILPLVIIVAVVVIGLLLWSRRDGTAPVADNARQAAGSAAPVAGGDGGANGASERSVDAARADADRLTTGTPTSTTAASLDSAFFNDPQGAALRYNGPVRVSGIIATMVTPGSTPALSLEGRSRLNYMIVNFPSGYRERLALLSKGQAITVNCGSVRALGGTTILNDCALD